MLRTVSIVAALGCAQGACSSSSNAKPDAMPDAISDAVACSDTMRIHVVERTGDNSVAVRPGLPGALVGVDLPGGTHQDFTADGSGYVDVTGIAWQLGAASVVARAPNHSSYAAVGVSPDTFAMFPKTEDGDLVMPLPSTDTPPTVTLTGAFTRATAGDAILLNADPGDFSQRIFIGAAAQYTLQVGVGAPITLVGAELPQTLGPALRWAQYSAPATTTNATMPLDLAAGGSALVPVETTTSITVPTSFAGMKPLPQVLSLKSGIALAIVPGTATSTQIPLETVTVAGEPPYTQFVLTKADGSLSRVLACAAPTDGASVTMPDPPPAPSTPVVNHTVPITGVPASAVVTLILTSASTSVRLDAPPGTTSIVLPSGLAGTAMTGQIGAYDTYLPACHLYANTAVGPKFSITP